MLGGLPGFWASADKSEDIMVGPPILVRSPIDAGMLELGFYAS